MKPLAIILLILNWSISIAQPRSVGLTQEQRDKINGVRSIEKRLRLYEKYIYRDSIRYWRETNRYWQHQTDSLNEVMVSGEKVLRTKTTSIVKKANDKLEKKVYKPWASQQSRQQLAWLDRHGFIISRNARTILLRYFEDYFLTATKDDSLLMALKKDMPGLPLPRQLNAKLDAYKILNAGKVTKPDFQQLQGELQDVKGLDKIKGLQQNGREHAAEFNGYAQQARGFSDGDSLKGFAINKAEQVALQQASGLKGFSEINGAQGEISKLQPIPGQYQTQVAQLQDSAYLKAQAKKKAEELAMKYIAENPQIMQGVQRKMNLLMKKYSFVPNSNDLSTAIKSASLKGQDLTERLVTGGNFQVLSLKPFAIDLSPSVGYKLSRNFVIGIGGNYRQTFSTDSIPRLAPQVLGYKAFVSHNVLRNFFVHGEFDRNSPGLKHLENKTSRTWTNAAFAGVGRKITVHRKVEMTVLVMYNFLHRQNDPVYPRPFVVKVGFQTSEIAMLKRRD